ncbi:hypothetical protein JM654_15860 [Microbacterium oxydans]|nr:hypothetical protein [Microbacterium oxydans]
MRSAQRPSRCASVAPAVGEIRGAGGDSCPRGTGARAVGDAFPALDAIGYAGPISISGRTPAWTGCMGLRRALALVRSLLWPQPEASFDAAFRNQ